jgi:hypothetical protein
MEPLLEIQIEVFVVATYDVIIEPLHGRQKEHLLSITQ